MARSTCRWLALTALTKCTRGHDTGDAQWFVNLKDNLRLGRDYTVFAEVTEGMDVVDGILEGTSWLA